MGPFNSKKKKIDNTDARCFEQFEAYFGLPISNNLPDKKSFLDKYQGKDFGNGIYRLFSYAEVEKWKGNIDTAYPDCSQQFVPFAYDWLGRCFAADLRSHNAGNVLMFEIGTMYVLEIPCDFNTFHNIEIPNNSEACLAASFFREWGKHTGVFLEHNKCAGYKIPLFLGGSDDLQNLEMSDMDVYWHILGSGIVK